MFLCKCPPSVLHLTSWVDYLRIQQGIDTPEAQETDSCLRKNDVAFAEVSANRQSHLYSTQTAHSAVALQLTPSLLLIFSFYWLLRTSSSWHLRGGIKDWSSKWNTQFITSRVGSDLTWSDADVVVQLQLGALHVRMSSVVSETTQKAIWMKCQAHHAAHSCPISHSKSVCSPNSLHHRVAKGRMSHRGISAWVGCMRRLMKRGPRAAFSPVVMS